MNLIRSAGGILWRESSGRLSIAVVHRARKKDWSLPKGKLNPREPWRQAALREVAEETGCAAAIDRFAGAKLFVDRRRPKLVLYWHMRLVRAGALEVADEVDEVAWLSRREALARLDHDSDRRLLLRAIADGKLSGDSVRPLSSDEVRRLVVVEGDGTRSERRRAMTIIARAARVASGSAASPALRLRHM